MATIILVLLLLRLAMLLLPGCTGWLQLKWQQLKRMFRNEKPITIFSDNFIEAKAFYLKEFKTVPCISYIGDIESDKVFDLVDSGVFGPVKATYQRNYHNWQKDQTEFSKTLFKLDGNVLVLVGESWVEVLFGNTNYDIANRMVDAFKAFKSPQKEEDYEINIITTCNNSLELKTLAIKPTTLDIGRYYNDDFKAVDATIKTRLAKENDKGIILLHGLPGTGKTTYLRHLIGQMAKKVLFVSPAVAGNLMNPEFMDLLLENPNAVLVIEDAENIIMDRKYSSQSSVSNLLNISDGLLSDCLNVQIICTFNSELSMVDSALLRKGRLIAKYEFGKLNAAKAQALSDHLGMQQVITSPMTLAEITNPEETHYEAKKVSVIGFRRMEEMIEN
ncbi:MAG: AAA family ATPase [Chitinophagaceae bacterium]